MLRASNSTRWRTALVLGPCMAAAAVAAGQGTERVSVDSAGGEGDGQSFEMSLDRAGRLIAFTSFADNLVAGDLNNEDDIFLHDRATGQTTLVSVDDFGVVGNLRSDSPHFAGHGGFVAFRSDATNLTPGDANGCADIYVRDLGNGLTSRVTHDFAGGDADDRSSAPWITADGRFVAFASLATNLVPGDANGIQDVFMADRVLQTTICLSVDPAGGVTANGACFDPSVTSDGRFAAFYSDASNLVAGDGNGLSDAFLVDVAAAVTVRVSVGLGGVEADGESFNCNISEDGRYVAFESLASNLVAGDTNNADDIFVYDRVTGTISRVSISTSGDESNGPSYFPTISSRGEQICFGSRASNFVAEDSNGQPDIFVHDLTLGTTHRASLRDDLRESQAGSVMSAIAGDGHVIAWTSGGSDFVPGDTNGFSDIFVHDLADASWQNYGTGLLGTNGIPGLRLTSDPVLGVETTLEIDNSLGARTIGVLFLGFDQAELPCFGGELVVRPLLTVPFHLPAAGLDITAFVQPVEAAEGVEVFLQVLEVDSGASDGIAFTPGLEMRLGW